MPGKPKGAVQLVYWDSSVFVSLFDGGRGRTQEEVDNLNFWADVIDDGEAIVQTSMLTLAEVLEVQTEHAMSSAQYANFEKFVYGNRVELQAVELGVIRRTKELREYVINNKLSPKLETPDAIHLATAAITNCTEFHTFDGAGVRRGLLDLSGKLPGVPKICTPKRFARKPRRPRADAIPLDLLEGYDEGSS